MKKIARKVTLKVTQEKMPPTMHEATFCAASCPLDELDFEISRASLRAAGGSAASLAWRDRSVFLQGVRHARIIFLAATQHTR